MVRRTTTTTVSMKLCSRSLYSFGHKTNANDGNDLLSNLWSLYFNRFSLIRRPVWIHCLWPKTHKSEQCIQYENSAPLLFMLFMLFAIYVSLCNYRNKFWAVIIWWTSSVQSIVSVSTKQRIVLVCVHTCVDRLRLGGTMLSSPPLLTQRLQPFIDRLIDTYLASWWHFRQPTCVKVLVCMRPERFFVLSFCHMFVVHEVVLNIKWLHFGFMEHIICDDLHVSTLFVPHGVTIPSCNLSASDEKLRDISPEDSHISRHISHNTPACIGSRVVKRRIRKNILNTYIYHVVQLSYMAICLEGRCLRIICLGSIAYPIEDSIVLITVHFGCSCLHSQLHPAHKPLSTAIFQSGHQ